ncbi:MAG TPA: carboxypeptidase-like regulatory domain-containing protein [Vicinamibacterales bacterium]|nr:carboxypeptidase-like regulatory domain-containing protein [Vicinamibacterales bacterium]
MPGASIELRTNSSAPQEVITDGSGGFVVDRLQPGRYELVRRLINFATAQRDVVVGTSGTLRVDVVLHFALNADATVTATHTFMNLADVSGACSVYKRCDSIKLRP